MLEVKQISLFTKIVQADGIVVSDMDGDKVMLSIKNGNYYNLGKIGGEIWDLIRTPINIKEVTEKLLRTYEIGEKDCQEHVLSFINDLLNQDLIQIIE